MPLGKPRVLVAGTELAIETCRRLLGESVELIAARSVEEALERLDSALDLIISSVRFDDSRMFDFLGALNAMPPSRRVPVICCRVARAPLSGGSRRGIELALEALGVAAFLDMHELEQRDGLAAAQAALREAVMARLAKSG